MTLRGIRNTTYNIQLQRDLDTLVDWSSEWLMLFEEKKCKVLHVVHIFHKTHTIENVENEKNLGSDDFTRSESIKPI